MASPQCMSNDGKPAVFIGTFFPSGDTVALCEDCFPAFTATVTADMFGVDGEKLLAWLKENEGEEPGTVESAAELAAPPDMPNGNQPAGEPEPEAEAEVPTTAEGAPSDEPPEEQPADTDQHAGAV